MNDITPLNEQPEQETKPTEPPQVVPELGHAVAEPILPLTPPHIPHVKPPVPPKKQSTFRSVASTLAILIIAPIIASALIAFVFQSYAVDGVSMANTLHDGDRLIIWKAPRTWARITVNDNLPKRDDVVIVVKKGLYEHDNKEKQLIKRVVALPGERVVVRDGVLTVYNTENPGGFQPDKTLPYGKDIPSTNGEVDTVVPAGSIFVVGDNRPNSLDSRSFGPIPEKDIVGKLIARVLPLSDAEKF